jgi:glyoxylase-like metal-dependent hydrolase (beta-lactamase superfamily II)
MCVVSSDASGVVQFHSSGHSNVDVEGTFTVRYRLPDEVRIVAEGDSPDIVFRGKDITAEARRNRRLDPQRLVAELEQHSEWIVSRDEEGWLELRYPEETADVRALVQEDRLLALETTADLPLRGRVPVRWTWHWTAETGSEPEVELKVDGSLMLRAKGERRTLSAEEIAEIEGRGISREERQVPAENWPARIDMRREALADGVWVVRGVRTGFHHLVVETSSGLIVADAPAGWVEIHQIPPADLVSGLGISGLSEGFIDFLHGHWPERPIRAVALTHVHDDHAGGARAFAADGASVYGPAAVAGFLERAFNRSTMPPDRLASKGLAVEVMPVSERLVLEDADRSVELLPLGAGPHVAAALGVWVPEAKIFFQSDLLVPGADSEAPRPERARSECWFARWAVENLPSDAVVLNSHNTTQLPVARLQRYTESDLCRN